MPGPDYTVLAGFIRNRVQEGRACEFILHKERIMVIPAAAWGSTMPEILVAGVKGSSLLVTEKTVLSPVAFVAGGFSLTRASSLAKVFHALKSGYETQSVRKHDGKSSDPSAGHATIQPPQAR